MYHTYLPPDPLMNAPITRSEVQKAVRCAGKGKACGFDGIPIECLVNENAISFMLNLFNHSLNGGIIPSSWKKSIIQPILKNKDEDPRIPSNYRGTSLASGMYELYCSGLNHRLTSWAESNDILVDEKNGFRQGGSCLDHLYVLSEIIQTRKKQKKNTFVAYIDFSQAKTDKNGP